MLQASLFLKWKKSFGGVFDWDDLITTWHSRLRYVQRIDNAINFSKAKQEIIYAVQNGMVLAWTEDEIVVRYLDAIYVCKTSNLDENEIVVATTLAHFMRQRALKPLRKKNNR